MALGVNTSAKIFVVNTTILFISKICAYFVGSAIIFGGGGGVKQGCNLKIREEKEKWGGSAARSAHHLGLYPPPPSEKMPCYARGVKGFYR